MHAVYKPFVTSLSSTELRQNGLPVIIAEGSFTDSDKLTALSNAGSGYVDSDMWTVTLPDDGRTVHTVRYLSAADPKKAAVTVTENGTSRTVKTETDGSYLVFQVSGGSFDLSVTEKPFPVYTVIPASAAAVIAAAVVIVRKKHNKKA